MPTINFTKTRKAAYKAINERSIEKNKEIISNLAPTVFAVSKELTQKDIYGDMEVAVDGRGRIIL